MFCSIFYQIAVYTSSGKWTILDKSSINPKKNLFFLKSKCFEFSTQDSSLKSLKHPLHTFYVLNNNFFYSQVASSYVPNNTDAFFLFFDTFLKSLFAFYLFLLNKDFDIFCVLLFGVFLSFFFTILYILINYKNIFLTSFKK